MKKIMINTLVIIISILVFCLAFNYKTNANPNIYYQVYLNGNTLGVITSKEELEKYIDEKNKEYKNKFNVKQVYAPNGLEIKKIETYNNKTSSIEEIYNKIAESEPFTIEGYQFTIKKSEEEPITIYTLNKEIFNNAVESAIKTFVSEETYQAYKEEEQSEITTTGTIIEKIYIDEDITIKTVNIPVTEKIYTDAPTLAKFFVFGEEESQNEYTVQIGDTIEDVAFNNEISIEEFLISNPSFTSATNILFPGQKVIIGVTNPQISVVVEEYTIKDQEVNYSVEVEYDENKVVGEDEIIQAGENGLERVTQRIKTVNGTINYVDPISKEELKPTINEIVVKGDKYIPTVGSTTNWLWPTNSGYTISSDYVYRISPITGRRELHAAIDISGTGYGSPIYAVTNGVVSESTHRTQDGNYVCINHNNGYYTCYAHMSKRNATVGQTVARGQIIGYVGQSGWATGPHVHFEVWINGRPWHGGVRISPWRMYR